MALTFRLYKIQKFYPLFVSSCKLVRASIQNQRRENNNSVVLEVDSFDDFTTQLIRSKLAKWENFVVRQGLLRGNISTPKECGNVLECNIQVKELSIKELDKVLIDAAEVNNTSVLKYVIKQCIDTNKLPSTTVLLQVLHISSENGDKNIIQSIIDLCEKLQPFVLNANARFLHFIAGAIWVRGNIKEAIDIFENIYRSNIYLRRTISSMLRCLSRTVPQRSEAVLVMLIGFGERIANDFNDYVPLMHFWRLCFLSEWYSDQCIAFDLLKRHRGLINALSNKLIPVVMTALRNDQTKVVYDLLEVLLMLEHKVYYVQVLQLLFDYRVKQGDLRGCSEIMQWALDHDVDLPILQQEMFVSLLLSYTGCLRSLPSTHMKKSISLSYDF